MKILPLLLGLTLLTPVVPQQAEAAQVCVIQEQMEKIPFPCDVYQNPAEGQLHLIDKRTGYTWWFKHQGGGLFTDKVGDVWIRQGNSIYSKGTTFYF